MFRSVRPYLEQAGITEPVVCYQGAAVVDPVDGAFLLHEPIALETAREAVARARRGGSSARTCYVDDELYVARHTEHSRTYADFQGLPVEEVGDLARLARPAADEARRGRRPRRASTCSATRSARASAGGCS